jgi:hypothetical protein
LAVRQAVTVVIDAVGTVLVHPRVHQEIAVVTIIASALLGNEQIHVGIVYGPIAVIIDSVADLLGSGILERVRVVAVILRVGTVHTGRVAIPVLISIHTLAASTIVVIYVSVAIIVQGIGTFRASERAFRVSGGQPRVAIIAIPCRVGAFRSLGITIPIPVTVHAR